MKGNQAYILPQDGDVMDRADDHEPKNHFNNPQDPILAGRDQQAMLHSKVFDNSPPQGPYTPTFGLNNNDNNNPIHCSVLTQGPKSAPCVSNQATSTLFNMPAYSFNDSVQEQNQGSADLFGMPYQDLMTLWHGQNQGVNNNFHPYFSDHIPSSEMVYADSGHHPHAQRGSTLGGDGDGYGAASQLGIPSPDQHPLSHGQNRMQNRGPNGGFNEQYSPVQQPNTEAHSHHQDIAHSFHGPLNEPQTRSRDISQGGRRSTHASPARSMAPHLFPGAHSPNLPAESNMIPRGRLNPAFHGLQTPVLAAPRSSNIQHSPPRRAFHSPITPEITPGFTNSATDISNTHAILSPALTIPSMPPIPSSMMRLSTNDTENLRRCNAREALIRQRLVLAEYLKKLNLQCFKSSNDERDTLEKDLATGWGRPDANENLQVLYAGELRLMEVNKSRDKYARGFRMCGEEIEELWGDLLVPGEQRSPDEAAIQ